MTYSIDLRETVLAYLEEGGGPEEASRLFKVTSRTIYNWRHAGSLKPKTHGPRKRKLDKAALARHVRERDDMLLRERAAHFGVHVNAIWVALKKMKAVKKRASIF